VISVLVSEARSQSGNAVGLGEGIFVGVAIGMMGLAGGIICQIVWNWSGAADATAGAAEKALR
jgi:hypothetical protein